MIYPQNISPLHPEGEEATSHVQLVPKEHCANSLVLEEDQVRELSSLKKMLARYFHKLMGNETQIVFIETFIQDIKETHMVIDAVAVTQQEAELEDIELYFRKIIEEGDS